MASLVHNAILTQVRVFVLVKYYSMVRARARKVAFNALLELQSLLTNLSTTGKVEIGKSFSVDSDFDPCIKVERELHFAVRLLV